MKIKNIIKKIKQEISYYDKVSLFIHKKPDGDTLGGCFGFKYFLENIYPKKDIRIVCLNTEQIPFNDIFKNDFKIADKNFIKDSIGFLIDIPNKMQLPTEEYLLCKFLVRIDHHIYTEKFGDFEWNDAKFSSACEMVSKLCFKWKTKCVDENVAKFLYTGISTDTGRFLYPCTTSSTLKIASKLLKCNFNLPTINNCLYTYDYNSFKFNNYLQSISIIDINIGFGYIVIPNDAFEKFNIMPMSFVNTISSVKELKIWTSVYYDQTSKCYCCSIRSRSIPINIVANNFNGGGHKLASGCKLNSLDEFNEVIKQLKSLLK